MLMRSVDSKGNLIGYAPHMAVIFVNDNNSISLAHYTGGKEMKSDDWSQKVLKMMVAIVEADLDTVHFYIIQ